MLDFFHTNNLYSRKFWQCFDLLASMGGGLNLVLGGQKLLLDVQT